MINLKQNKEDYENELNKMLSQLKDLELNDLSNDLYEKDLYYNFKSNRYQLEPEFPNTWHLIKFINPHPNKQELEEIVGNKIKYFLFNDLKNEVNLGKQLIEGKFPIQLFLDNELKKLFVLMDFGNITQKRTIFVSDLFFKEMPEDTTQVLLKDEFSVSLKPYFDRLKSQEPDLFSLKTNQIVFST